MNKMTTPTKNSLVIYLTFSFLLLLLLLPEVVLSSFSIPSSNNQHFSNRFAESLSARLFQQQRDSSSYLLDDDELKNNNNKINCSNLGHPDPKHPDASCICPLPQFSSGPTCDGRMCMKDGVAESKPNNDTNVCSCPDPSHNEGISCQLCKNGGGCPADSFCDETILSIGPDLLESNAECQVVDDSFNGLLGGVGVATYNCILPNQTQGNADGNCAVSFFRQNSDPLIYDNYFRCNLEKCTATQQDVSGGTSQNISTATKHLFAFARVVVLLLMVCFAGFRFVSEIPRRARLVAAFSAITICLLALLMLMILVVSSQKSDQLTQSMVVYDCDKSSCQCYDDVGHSSKAGSGGDSCSGSMFGEKVLPVLVSGATLKCQLGGGFTHRQCTFVQKDLSSEVALNCRGSVCRSKNPVSPPAAPSDAINQSHVKKEEDPKNKYTFFDVVKQKATSTTVLIIGAVLGITALIFYVTNSMKESARMSEEFKERFLNQRVQVGADNTENAAATRSFSENSVFSSSASTTSDSQQQQQQQQQQQPHQRQRNMDDIFLPQSRSELVTSKSSDDVNNSNNNNSHTLSPTSPDTFPAQQQQQPHFHHRHHESSSSSSTPEMFSLSTMNLCYTVQNTTSANANATNTAVLPITNVLRNVTVHLPGGHLVAILGASGSSKTSLLETMAGMLSMQRSSVMTGCVMADHREIFPNPMHDAHIATEFQSFCAVSSFVAQQDILLASLTVREMIYYSARLKLPALLEPHELMEIVDIVIDLLRLEECADRLIGGGTSDIRGLSGGERRRVSIATELVGLPRFILLDEPCSGLDASNALHVAECLADIARGRSRLFRHPSLGKFAHYRPLVVFSVHQPSEAMYRLFDTTILMNKGRAVYCGSSVSALPFLLEHVREEVMSKSINLTVPERLLSISEYADYELDKAAAATSKSMMATLVSAAATSNSDTSYSNDVVLQTSASTPTRSSLANPPSNSWLHDEEGGAASANRNANPHLNYYSSQQQQELQSMRDRAELTPISRVQIAANNRARYAQSWVSQVGYLIIRGWRSTNVTNYDIMFSHAISTLFIGSALALLYHAQPLTLPGALDRAGSMTYMLLVTAFLSLSAIDWIVSERRLLQFERRNHCYGTAQYFLSKVFVDFLPYRAVPSAALSILVYAPMGLRTDGGSYFAWFALVNGLFAIQTSAMTMCAAALTSTFGAAALLSAIIILWNFVFCGLLIQAGTLPALFVPFRDISPFFLAFEALLVNELDGQNCQFAPVDASGRPSSHQIPLYCRQYLYNLGLVPENFSRDVLTLAMWCGFFFFLAGLCLHGVPEFVRVAWAKLQKYTCRKCCSRYYYAEIDGLDDNTTATTGGDGGLNLESAHDRQERENNSTSGRGTIERTPLVDRRHARDIEDDE